MARQTPDEAYELTMARAKARRDEAEMAAHRNDPPPPKPRSKWLLGCGALAGLAAVVTLAYCVLSGARAVKEAAGRMDAEAKARPAPPPKPVPATPGYAVATKQVSRAGEVEADIVAASLWPFDGGTLLLIVKVRGLPAGSDYPAKWARNGSDAILRPEGGGQPLRRVPASKTLDSLPPTAGGCALLYEVGAGTPADYAIDLPVGGGRALRFRVPAAVQTPGFGPESVAANDPFARPGAPVDSGM